MAVRDVDDAELVGYESNILELVLQDETLKKAFDVKDLKVIEITSRTRAHDDVATIAFTIEHVPSKVRVNCQCDANLATHQVSDFETRGSPYKPFESLEALQTELANK